MNGDIIKIKIGAHWLRNGSHSLCGPMLRHHGTVGATACVAPEMCVTHGCVMYGPMHDAEALAAELSERAAMWGME